MKGLAHAKCVWVCRSNNVTGKQNQLCAISLKVFGPGDSTQKKIQETRIFTLIDALQKLKEVCSGSIYSAEKWLTFHDT